MVGVDFLNVSAVDLAFDDSRVGSGEDIERDGVPVEIKTRLRAWFFSAKARNARKRPAERSWNLRPVWHEESETSLRDGRRVADLSDVCRYAVEPSPARLPRGAGCTPPNSAHVISPASICC